MVHTKTSIFDKNKILMKKIINLFNKKDKNFYNHLYRIIKHCYRVIQHRIAACVYSLISDIEKLRSYL